MTNTPFPTETIIADYHNPQHAEHIVSLMDSYARDPMGGGQGLAEEVKEALVNELAKRSFAFSVLCYVGTVPAGLTNCFEGFSTFAAKPLINVHDIVVHPDFRGRNLSQTMLAKVEQIARNRSCCKITLEVLSGNSVAQQAYRKFGFEHYQLDPAAGQAQFWHKKLR